MDHNPKKFGPGIWSNWHILTLKHLIKKEKEILIRIIKWTIDTLPCMECRTHATEYLLDNPFPPLTENGDELFVWTVEFHNTVNERLGKIYIDVEDAKKLWSGDNICLQDCGDEIPVDIDIEVDDNDKGSYVYKIY